MNERKYDFIISGDHQSNSGQFDSGWVDQGNGSYIRRQSTWWAQYYQLFLNIFEIFILLGLNVKENHLLVEFNWILTITKMRFPHLPPKTAMRYLTMKQAKKNNQENPVIMGKIQQVKYWKRNQKEKHLLQI